MSNIVKGLDSHLTHDPTANDYGWRRISAAKFMEIQQKCDCGQRAKWAHEDGTVVCDDCKLEICKMENTALEDKAAELHERINEVEI
ncbi:MAG: hypothetical protein WC736_15200 [Gallionella sp.]